MQDIIDGFLKFRREAFPQRSALYKELATSQHPARCSSRVPTAGSCRSSSRSRNPATCS